MGVLVQGKMNKLMKSIKTQKYIHTHGSLIDRLVGNIDFSINRGRKK